MNQLINDHALPANKFSADLDSGVDFSKIHEKFIEPLVGSEKQADNSRVENRQAKSVR